MSMCYFKVFYDGERHLSKLSDEECGKLFKGLLRYGRDGSVPEFGGALDLIFEVHRAQLDRDKAAYDKKCAQNRRYTEKHRQKKEDITEYYDDEAADTPGEAPGEARGEFKREGETPEQERLKQEGETPEQERLKQEGEALKQEKRTLKQEREALEGEENELSASNIIYYQEKEKEKEKENKTKSKRKTGARGAQAHTPVYRPENGHFLVPEVGEVESYCRAAGLNVNAQSFCDFYASKGWLVGSSPMSDWQAAARRWAANGRGAPGRVTTSPAGILERETVNDRDRFEEYYAERLAKRARKNCGEPRLGEST